MRPQRPKALVVLNDRDEAARLSALLQTAGLQTAMAFNSGMGLRTAALFIPALLLIDRDIEGGDAKQFVRSLSVLGPRVASGLCICVGCDDAHPDSADLRSGGINGFLPRPIDLDALPMLVADSLKRISPASSGPAINTSHSRK